MSGLEDASRGSLTALIEKLREELDTLRSDPPVRDDTLMIEQIDDLFSDAGYDAEQVSHIRKAVQALPEGGIEVEELEMFDAIPHHVDEGRYLYTYRAHFDTETELDTSAKYVLLPRQVEGDDPNGGTP